MQKLPTLKDVANHAGVSTATVRRVLYSNGYVADQTRNHVLTALDETGYRVNAIAQGLRAQRTLTIGNIVQSITPNPFFAAVALGVENEAHAYGCGVLMYNVHGDPELERAGVEALLQRRVDAIVFTVPIDAANVRLASAAQIPVVQIERVTHTKTHTVTVDNYVGAISAMEHLIGLGHQRIAFISADPTTYPPTSTVFRQPAVEHERLAGYCDTLRRYKVPVDPALMKLGRYILEDGYAFTNELLASPARPTAIFAAADVLAAGALQAVYEAKLRVPDDISIIGFDNTFAPYLAPGLTTVEQPMALAGQIAARIALQTAPLAPDEPLRDIRLTTKLVVRASTGAARRATE